MMEESGCPSHPHPAACHADSVPDGSGRLPSRAAPGREQASAPSDRLGGHTQAPAWLTPAFPGHPLTGQSLHGVSMTTETLVTRLRDLGSSDSLKAVGTPSLASHLSPGVAPSQMEKQSGT